MPAHCAPVVIHKVPPHMSLLHILAILIWLAAVFRFLNHRYLQLPTAIDTWGGLCGGIPVALALPAGEVRDALVTVTCVVVLFSIVVQGLSIGPLVQHAQSPREPRP
jgi:NhaP-type Na+/H+ or K+/H+ antiporter